MKRVLKAITFKKVRIHLLSLANFTTGEETKKETRKFEKKRKHKIENVEKFNKRSFFFAKLFAVDFVFWFADYTNISFPHTVRRVAPVLR